MEFHWLSQEKIKEQGWRLVGCSFSRTKKLKKIVLQNYYIPSYQFFRSIERFKPKSEQQSIIFLINRILRSFYLQNLHKFRTFIDFRSSRSIDQHFPISILGFHIAWLDNFYIWGPTFLLLSWNFKIFNYYLISMKFCMKHLYLNVC